MSQANSLHISYTGVSTTCIDGQYHRNCLMEKILIWFNEEFLQNYDEDGDKGYILEVGEYPEELKTDRLQSPVQRNEVKYYPQNYCKDCCYFLHKYKL